MQPSLCPCRNPLAYGLEDVPSHSRLTTSTGRTISTLSRRSALHRTKEYVAGDDRLHQKQKEGAQKDGQGEYCHAHTQPRPAARKRKAVVGMGRTVIDIARATSSPTSTCNVLESYTWGTENDRSRNRRKAATRFAKAHIVVFEGQAASCRRADKNNSLALS